MALPASSGKQDTAKARKKPRRASRSDASTPSNYGPIACTSGNAALVQAYLTIDVQRTDGAGKDSLSVTSRTAMTTQNASVLHMAESRFDTDKRRFGGKSKPVCASSGVDESAGRRRGHRLAFGPSATIVATREAMHAVLHCRCIFVLLYEAAGSESAGINGTSDNSTVGNCKATSTISGKRGRDGGLNPPDGKIKRSAETAHLVALSPDDLFSALSVDSFSLTLSSEADGPYGGRSGRGGTASDGRHSRENVAPSAALSRAFEVLDGPIVVHRPATHPGEHWRGLEVFRPVRASRRAEKEPCGWVGERCVAPMAAAQAIERTVEGRGRSRTGDMFGYSGGRDNVENITGSRFRLNMPSLKQRGGESSLNDESEHHRRNRSEKVDLLVCPPSECCSVLDDSAFRRSSGSGCAHTTSSNLAATIIALPDIALSPAATTLAADETPMSLEFTGRWACLAVDDDGRASLAPWRGSPSSLRKTFTCMCHTPASDSGIVGLADATPDAHTRGGLVLNALPRALYVGASAEIECSEPRLAAGGGGGCSGRLLELQAIDGDGGALSCVRSLPAPPVHIVPAAVDDGKGVLAVLLADRDATALLLARDGCDFPIVEEYRGVSAVFSGDFLGNGREQVALLPTVASPPIEDAIAGALSTAGAARWAQLSLKSLAKRALLTDCSCVWGNGHRDDLAALPGSGPIYVVGTGPSESSRKSAAVAIEPEISSGGRKRSREEGLHDAAGERSGAVGSTAGGAVPVGSGRKRSEGEDDDHRLGRLSTVVGVLRRRVQAEEARLLRLRQARRGKAALLEAAKLALMVCGGEASNSDGTVELSQRLSATVDVFKDGTVPFLPRAQAPEESLQPAEKSTARSTISRHPLQCSVDGVRFHAPSRTLCLDTHVRNRHNNREGGEYPENKMGAVAANVCVSLVSASGRLSTRSAVCPRLSPGQSAVVRATVEVPPTLLASAGRSSNGAVSLYASCSWSWDYSRARDRGTIAQLSPTAGSSGNRNGDDRRGMQSSVIFARVSVTPQDMLGVGVLGPSAGGGSASLAPIEFPLANTDAEKERKRVQSPPISDKSSASDDGDANTNEQSSHHLGLFDVGMPLSLLVRSDTASLAALPQAVRALSNLAAMPEPWAGGAIASVDSCSERAAECTLRAGDSIGASTVLVQVAAGALPDGAKASVNHASAEACALIAAAAQALQDEMAAVEAVAKEKRYGKRTSADVGDSSGRKTEGGGLALELETYTEAQMRSDVLASQLVGRLVAAAAAAGRDP